MTTSGGVVRIAVIYTGRVQGVCFRATTHEIATRHGVVGWVRNRADGAVAMEAQGAPAQVEALLRDIARQYAGYIADTERRPLPPDDADREFTIRR